MIAAVGEVGDAVAAGACDAVAIGKEGETVRARAAAERVVAGAADQEVVAAIAGKHVVAGAGLEQLTASLPVSVSLPEPLAGVLDGHAIGDGEAAEEPEA